jgi:phosphonate degradation associated HDIG domain protein
MESQQLIDRIECLFLAHGHEAYDGARRESVTALEHALQCAQLAEWAHADAPLVAAALLHDIGHFLDGTLLQEHVDDGHEQHAAAFLSQCFGAAVVEPVRLHVQAKRYLVSTDSRYAGTLSAASAHTLALQGGAMTADECRAFEALPHAEDALCLRRWDDAAKAPLRRTPSLGYYLSLLSEVAAYRLQRTAIGALDVS